MNAWQMAAAALVLINVLAMAAVIQRGAARKRLRQPTDDLARTAAGMGHVHVALAVVALVVVIALRGGLR